MLKNQLNDLENQSRIRDVGTPLVTFVVFLTKLYKVCQR
jgi:hypothetical protein